MQYLKIIDNGSIEIDQWNITVELTNDENNLTHQCLIEKQHFSCIPEHINWYYSGYLLKPFGRFYKRGKEVHQQLNTYGKSLGRELFNDAILAEIKPAELIVTIESSSAVFLSFAWESLYLPNNTHEPLSVLAKSFIRTNVVDSQDKNEVTQYKLNSSESKLSILFISPRPSDCKDLPFCCTPEIIFQNMHELGDFANVQLQTVQSFSELKSILALSENNPIHILHYNGYVSNEQDLIQGLLFESEEGTSERIAYDDFSALVGKHKVDTVFIDAASFASEAEEKLESISGRISPDIAISLLKEKVNNVIIPAYGNYAVYAQRFYSIILSSIANGKKLSESIVNARMIMRNNLSQTVLTIQDIEFADWLLVQHYSAKDTQFFAEPITLQPLENSEHYKTIVTKIIGFDQDYLMRGFLGRAHETRALNRILHGHKIAYVTGDDGIGKTHFLHRFAFWHLYKKQVKRAMYFDCSKSAYSKASVLQIVFDMLADKNLTLDDVQKEIETGSYLFVFDNIDRAKFKDGAQKEALYQYLIAVSKTSSSVIFSANTEFNHNEDKSLFNANSIPLVMSGLNALDSRQFSSAILKKSNCIDAEEMSGYYDLLDALKGAPYQMQILLPLLGQAEPEAIKSVYCKKEQEFNHAIFALFSYGWATCDLDCKKILFALKDCHGYITEGLIVGVDKSDSNEVLREFYNLIGVQEPYLLGKAFKQACKIGLYVKKEFGYEIHPQAASFLEQQQEVALDVDLQVDLKASLSKLFVIELQMLYAFISRHPEKAMFQIIIANNSRWFVALARLWEVKNYIVFNAGINYLFNIFSILGLKIMVESWAFQHLLEHKFDAQSGDNQKEYYIAWLQLATHALVVPQAMEAPFIKEAVSFWQDDMLKQKDKDIFNVTLVFLEAYFRCTQDRVARKALSNNAVRFYTENNDYEKIILAMRSLANSEEALGNIAEAKIVEDSIVSQIPFEQLQQGIKQKTFLSLAMSKANRKEYQDARELVNLVKACPDSVPYYFAADTILADMLNKEGEYEQALEKYTGLWATIIMGERKQQNSQHEQNLIASKLNQLAEKLGEEDFNRIFKKIAPDIKSPLESQLNKPQEIMST